MKRLAVIDIGTNSIRLDIRELEGEKWRLLLRKKDIIRLGRGVFTSGALDPGSTAALFENLDRFSRHLRKYEVDETICVGTSALREAANSADVLDRIRATYGFEVQIISGQREAELIARGVLENERELHGTFVLIDIGGGSTELTGFQSHRRTASVSLPLGALRLQELFLKTIPPLPTPEHHNPVAALREHVDSVIRAETSGRAFPLPAPLVGTSGTVKAVGRILGVVDAESETETDSAQSRPQYSRRDLRALIERIMPLTADEIAAIPRIDRKRAEVILAGALLLDQIMEHFGAENISVSEYSLRDGIYDERLRANASNDRNG